MKRSEFKLRNVAKANVRNDGSRSIFESTLHPQVAIALKKWIRAKGQGVLIGRLALSFYVKPMMTDTIELLFPAEESMPHEVRDFTRVNERKFRHGETRVEIGIFTANSLNISSELAGSVEETAILHKRLKIANPNALAVLKLQRPNAQDEADIAGLIKAGFVNELSAPWNLDEIKGDTFRALLAKAHDEIRRNI